MSWSQRQLCLNTCASGWHVKCFSYELTEQSERAGAVRAAATCRADCRWTVVSVTGWMPPGATVAVAEYDWNESALRAALVGHTLNKCFWAARHSADTDAFLGPTTKLDYEILAMWGSVVGGRVVHWCDALSLHDSPNILDLYVLTVRILFPFSCKFKCLLEMPCLAHHSQNAVWQIPDFVFFFFPTLSVWLHP